jgi:aminoglycoside/choline kinase family phosphotransferase
MSKFDGKDFYATVSALRNLGGIGMFSAIDKEAQKTNFGNETRRVLRYLENKKLIKSDRPLLPLSLELRWEVIDNAKIETFKE